jgi:hypothetical protein
MKHCPQCNFLYHDSDELCDLDKTPLIADALDIEANMSREHPAATLTLTAAVHDRKLNVKTLSAATLAGLVIGLILLLGYQKMRPTLQASQAPPTAQSQVSQDFRASRVAQVSREVIAKVGVPKEESSEVNTPAAKASPTTSSKTPDTRPGSARLRISENPVSTGDMTRPARGPVTIRFVNGSSLQADEVWRTKAGVWYRRKGIVTLVKASSVRAVSN